MVSARTYCPMCFSTAIAPIDDLLWAETFEYFRCDDCLMVWELPRGSDQPLTAFVLGALELPVPRFTATRVKRRARRKR